MVPAQIRRLCAHDLTIGNLLEHAPHELTLSARAYDHILKVARTIADLPGPDSIQGPHLLKAIQYRALDHTRPV